MDPIADMFIRIMNAYRAGKASALFPYSNEKNDIARVLKARGFIKDTEKKGKKVRKFLEVMLAYRGKIPAMSGITRISKPSRRIYAGSGDLEKFRKGYGAVIVSTSRGVMEAGEAKKAGIGGEIIARIW